MKRSKILGALGFVAFLLAFAGVTALVICLRNPERVAHASGERALAKHLAEPLNMTADVQMPASYFAQIQSFTAWHFVPIDAQIFRGVPLQIDGMICLWGGGNAKAGAEFPEEKTGIQIGKKFETLYVYHGSFYNSPSGTPVYQIVFRYEDGTLATNQILYGEDVLDWYGHGKVTAARSKIAWQDIVELDSGQKQPLQFCLTAVENPQPNIVVTTIDLYSCKSRTAACILAFTPGHAGLMH